MRDYGAPNGMERRRAVGVALVGVAEVVNVGQAAGVERLAPLHEDNPI